MDNKIKRVKKIIKSGPMYTDHIKTIYDGLNIQFTCTMKLSIIKVTDGW